MRCKVEEMPASVGFSSFAFVAHESTDEHVKARILETLQSGEAKQLDLSGLNLACNGDNKVEKAVYENREEMKILRRKELRAADLRKE